LFSNLLNAFRIPELRNKLLFTIGMLIVYRIGFYVPLPGVNALELHANAAANADSALGALSNYLSTFSGGDLGQSTIFGLGIMPYISASIIIQLMGTVLPSLEKLKKEGEPGMRKITEWTRYLTIAVCLVQSTMWISHLMNSDRLLLYPGIKGDFPVIFFVMGVTVLTAGSTFLMWLGEQVDEYGIGNGVSLIITAGIVARMPDSIAYVYTKSPFHGFFENFFGGIFTLDFHRAGNAFQSIGKQMLTAQIGLSTVLFLVCCFVFVVAGSIFLTQAQRRIKIQQAKQMRGRRVYGGQAQYLPLRVNHGGVMPIIFASSLMLFPRMGLSYLSSVVPEPVNNQDFGWAHLALARVISFLHINLNYGTYLDSVVFCAMIFFFSYFWNTVQFQPKEMATQLRDYGSFVPGLRPGKRTADYLENVMFRITYVGAAFLCVIAVIPSLVATYMLGGGDPRDGQVAQMLGGTGILIVISVMLDLVTRIEANLVMRNYGGFSDSNSGSGSGAKIRRPKGVPSRGPMQPQPAAVDSRNPKGLPA
jgi:preprotein translocase subunit SecY